MTGEMRQVLARLGFFVAQLATDLSALRGWRRYLAAFLAGALSVVALAPFGFPFILFLSFPVLVWLLDGAARLEDRRDRLKQAALLGWLFGFGYFLLGLYWIGVAFFVEAEKFALLSPLAIIGLPAGLAFFPAAAAAAAQLYWRPGYARVLALAIAWALSEWLRGHILTGFPWNMVGEALAASDGLLQIGALIGAYGLTFLAVAIFAAPAAQSSPSMTGPAKPGQATQASSETGSFAFWKPSVAALMVLALLWVGGTLRLATANGTPAPGAPGAPGTQGTQGTPGDQITVRIVQPNVQQQDKWRPENRSAILGQYLRMSAAGNKQEPSGLAGIDMLIWPEAALPFLMAREPFVMSAIANMLPPGTVLVTGAMRAEADAEAPSGELSRFFNSIFVISSDGKILSAYDKAHLTPFGEYLPFKEALSAIGLETLVNLKGSLDFGPGPRLLELPGLPTAAPLICYEIIFPGIIPRNGARPGWILNVTNDAWFGDTAGPHQHFLQARLRAVEEGLPVIRSAGNGISGVIDAYGRVGPSLALNQAGIIDSQLPPVAVQTLYMWWGDIGLVLFLIIAGVFLYMKNYSSHYEEKSFVASKTLE